MAPQSKPEKQRVCLTKCQDKSKKDMGSKKMSFFLKFLVLPILVTGMLVCEVQGDAHYYDFVLKESNFTRLCCSNRVMTVNESLPGPVIRIHRGDTVYVNVQNEDDYGVTMHWHGVKQTGNPWSDGPEFITQCSIRPRTNFTYKVIFGKDQEGTLWWHAHSNWTRVTVHGAIVILPAEGTTYPFPNPDAEEVIVLGSWYKGDVNKEVEEDLTNASARTPESNFYTINGQPGDFAPCSKGTTYRFLVDYGKTYLFRIVNAVLNRQIFFAISGHNLTIVGTDATYTKQFSTRYIMIAPGQTIDALVTMDQSPSYYYMAARASEANDYIIHDHFDHSNATAIIEYRGNYTAPAAPSFPAYLPTFHQVAAAYDFLAQFRSLASPEYPVHVPLDVTSRMFITVSINNIVYDEGVTTPTLFPTFLLSSLNNISFVNPYIDVLQAYYGHISGVYTTDFPDEPAYYYNFTSDLPSPGTLKATKAKVFNYNETVEIILQVTNLLDGAEDHPIHLHGYTFYVIGSGYGVFNNETDPLGFNFVDPPERNTVTVPANGWVALRFVANNPGVWLFHCHFDRHLTWGMGTVFIVKDGGTPETSLLPPPANMPPCLVPSPVMLEDLRDSVTAW